MPERWYELLRERMQVERQRMRAVKDGSITEDGDLQNLLTEAQSLDRQMLQISRSSWRGKKYRADGRHNAV